MASHELLPEEREGERVKILKKIEKEKIFDDILLSKVQEVGGC